MPTVIGKKKKERIYKKNSSSSSLAFHFRAPGPDSIYLSDFIRKGCPTARLLHVCSQDHHHSTHILPFPASTYSTAVVSSGSAFLPHSPGLCLIVLMLLQGLPQTHLKAYLKPLSLRFLWLPQPIPPTISGPKCLSHIWPFGALGNQTAWLARPCPVSAAITLVCIPQSTDTGRSSSERGRTSFVNLTPRVLVACLRFHLFYDDWHQECSPPWGYDFIW